MKSTLLLCFSLLMMTVMPAATSAVTLRTADEKKMTGEEIVAKHLEAVGGRAALTKFKTRVALGTVKKENEPEGRLAIMSEAPNRLSAYYGFVQFDLRMVYDGNNASMRPVLPRTLSAFMDRYQDMIGSGFMLNGISLYNLLASDDLSPLKLEAKGTKKVAGRPAYVVQVKPRKGPNLRLYFDAENFMWVRTDYGRATLSKQQGTFTNDVVNQASGELTVDFYVETSDFREVDGVKLPFKFVQMLTRPLLNQSDMGTITGTISEYKHNVQIDPKMFQ